MWDEIKARLFKYEAIHGLYKIPLGLVLIYVAYDNIPTQLFTLDTIRQILQLRYMLHIIAALIGFRALFEGLHDLFHNPYARAISLQLGIQRRSYRLHENSMKKYQYQNYPQNANTASAQQGAAQQGAVGVSLDASTLDNSNK